MFEFFLGMFIGAVVIDTLWAWRIGFITDVYQNVRLKFKLWKAKKL